MITVANNARWEPTGLREVGYDWVANMRNRKKESSYKSMWWGYLFSWEQKINSTIETFINASYLFSPMMTFRFTDQIVTALEYKDRLILNFLRKIISPVVKHIMPNCYHLNGPTGIKKAIDFVRNSMKDVNYKYFIIADIKDYYASIDRNILVKQTQKHFMDLRLVKYLESIITTAIDDGGKVTTPKLGIPRGSSLSPIFGALYLEELYRAFHKNTGISYCRFMDDGAPRTRNKRLQIIAEKVA